MEDKLKERLVKEYGGECIICGYKKCLAALHFHHINPFEKDFNISEKTRLTKELREELDKCVILCANHHAEAHQGLIDPETLTILADKVI